MSLQIKQSSCETCSCKQLWWSDKTGAYDSITNTTGYGGINLDTTDAVSAVLTITMGDGTTIYNIDVFSEGFPTANTETVYVIPNESIGYVTGDKIPDQLLTFLYTVTFNDGSIYTSTIYQGLTCQSECCVDTMFSKIDICCDDCSATALSNWIQAKVLYEGLLSIIDIGDIVAFNKALGVLGKICKNSGCKSC
jgi:hypothetical protein